MYYNPKMYSAMPMGVVLRKTPGVTQWAAWAWRAVAVLPGAGPADWRVLLQDGDCVEYHAATVMLELHGAETESYLTGLSAQVPCVYVVLRASDDAEAPSPLEVVLVTASPYEAQDYTDGEEDIVEKVPMPAGLIAWVHEFVQKHHNEEVFIKRKRDKKRVDFVEDGIGDPRVSKPADIYASPNLKRRRLQ